uniref:F-box domain-containing protein n=1 Tax=Syphacia muris TaxID=451379 RepID=A0A0N5ASP9_9BILA
LFFAFQTSESQCVVRARNVREFVLDCESCFCDIRFWYALVCRGLLGVPILKNMAFVRRRRATPPVSKPPSGRNWCISDPRATVLHNRMLMAKILRNVSDVKDRASVELCSHQMYKYSRQRGCPYLAPNIDNGYLEISYRGQLRALEVKIAGNTKRFSLQLSAAGWISSEALGVVREGLEQLLSRFRHQIYILRLNRLHFSMDLVDMFSVLRKVQTVSFSQSRFSADALRWWLQPNNVIHQRVTSYCFHRISGNNNAMNLLTNLLTSRLHTVCMTAFNSKFFVEMARKLVAVEAPIDLIFISIAPRMNPQEPNLEEVLNELSAASQRLHVCITFPYFCSQGLAGYERFKLLPSVCCYPKVTVLELSLGSPTESAMVYFETFFKNFHMMSKTLRVLHITADGIDDKLNALTEAMCIGFSDLTTLEELTLRGFRDKLSVANCTKIWNSLPTNLRTFGLFTIKNFTHEQLLTLISRCPLIENLVLLEVQQLRSKTILHILNNLPALRSTALNLWDAVDDELIKLLLNRQLTPSLDAVSLCFNSKKNVISRQFDILLQDWFRFRIDNDATFYEPYIGFHIYRTTFAHEGLKKVMRFGACPACAKDAIVEM